MIKVKKIDVDIPSKLKDLKTLEKIRKQFERQEKFIQKFKKSHPQTPLQKILTKGKKAYHFGVRNYYKNKTVKEKLKVIYRGKCAYCERKIGKEGYGEVEHYRSKGEVLEDLDHSGYYWLAYEWSNLLWSCKQCNLAKSSHFPIEGTRASLPPQDPVENQANSLGLLAEAPLFLNPELDDPREHLCFTKDGRIVAYKDSPRGKKTWELCKLNRKTLVDDRKKIIDDIRAKLQKYVKGVQVTGDREFLLFSSHLSDLLKLQRPDSNFSSLGRQLWSEFETFFVEELRSQEQREILRDAFHDFKVKIEEGLKKESQKEIRAKIQQELNNFFKEEYVSKEECQCAVKSRFYPLLEEFFWFEGDLSEDSLQSQLLHHFELGKEREIGKILTFAFKDFYSSRQK